MLKFMIMKFIFPKSPIWLKTFSIIVFLNVCLQLKAAGTKIRVVTKIDGVDREYFVHIPMNYDSTKAQPLVFMLHGTSGDGETFYNAYGWTELADKEGFLTVFPSSGRYKIITQGEMNVTTKWNTPPDAEWTFVEGQKPLDDIKFLRTIITEMRAKYKIDSKRIYLNGFSNGGQMAAKCAIEMSDVLAAVCSNAGSFYLDTIYKPKRKLPYLYEVGNRDYGPGNEGPEFPQIPLILLDSLISIPNLPYQNGKHYLIDNDCIRNFNLKRQHVISGDTSFVVVATHQPNKPGPGTGYEFKFVYVKDLGHQYPNGKIHPYDAVTNHWNWMKQYVLEDSTSKSTFNLTVNNGYGSGSYNQNDTVHIWSQQIDGKVFTNWSGDTQYLESPNEYHSRVIIPNKPVVVSANYATLSSTMKLSEVSIKGAKENKNVFLYMPPKNKIKAVVWIFHGSGGNALNMVTNIETRQFIDLMMTKDYGIVAITSEESQDNTDYNNDGELRWTYGLDSTLTDIANVRAIRDTLINRGAIDKSTAHIAYGWSAGGAFTEFVVNVLNWKAAVAHTVSGSSLMSMNANKPFFINIGLNDDHPNVGPTGNAEARVNIKNYQSRGVCAQLYESKAAPLFPERFDRSNLISEVLSKSIFNEIKSNGGLDQNNYMVSTSGKLKQAVGVTPGKFPVIRSLTSQQQDDVIQEMAATNSEHMVKADINNQIILFIENLCATVTPTVDEIKSIMPIRLYPNPVSGTLTVPNVKAWRILNIAGECMMLGNSNTIDVSRLANGMYFISTNQGIGKFIKH